MHYVVAISGESFASLCLVCICLSLTNQSNRTVLPRKVRLVGRNVVRACHDYNSQLGPRYRPKLFDMSKNSHIHLIIIFCQVGIMAVEKHTGLHIW